MPSSLARASSSASERVRLRQSVLQSATATRTARPETADRRELMPFGEFREPRRPCGKQRTRIRKSRKRRRGESCLGSGSDRAELDDTHYPSRTSRATWRYTKPAPALTAAAVSLIVSILAGDQFPQPLAVMPPRPAAGHLTARHGADRAAHPDRRVDMDDPDADDDDRRARVDQDRDALLLDGEVAARNTDPRSPRRWRSAR